ncbi:TPA: DUF4760 domain-containing protein [Campylobacter coli]|nr:DUF4760 domain-containing protein [Campylobacter coli]HEB9427911.1 DUF4760 domain-containing protein [Campylobacter coli]HEF1256340.1 DUF4760 domain-containing protein [Campylobacter coli]HEH4748252.1 DUF4760 domain-containing protein [Campylobacter coli]
MKLLKNWYFVLWLIGFFAIVCLCLYFNLEIKTIAYIISAYAVSCSLVLNAYSIFEKTRADFEKTKVDKFNLTIQMILKWDEKHFIEARDYTRKQHGIQNKLGKEEITREIENNLKLERSVRMMLNYFEVLQTLIQNNSVDEDIIMEHFAHLMVEVMRDRYDDYINKKIKPINPLGAEKLELLKMECENYVNILNKHKK